MGVRWQTGLFAALAAIGLTGFVQCGRLVRPPGFEGRVAVVEDPGHPTPVCLPGAGRHPTVCLHITPVRDMRRTLSDAGYETVNLTRQRMALVALERADDALPDPPIWLSEGATAVWREGVRRCRAWNLPVTTGGRVHANPNALSYIPPVYEMAPHYRDASFHLNERRDLWSPLGICAREVAVSVWQRVLTEHEVRHFVEVFTFTATTRRTKRRSTVASYFEIDKPQIERSELPGLDNKQAVLQVMHPDGKKRSLGSRQLQVGLPDLAPVEVERYDGELSVPRDCAPGGYARGLQLEPADHPAAPALVEAWGRLPEGALPARTCRIQTMVLSTVGQPWLQLTCGNDVFYSDVEGRGSAVRAVLNAVLQAQCEQNP